jgi:hypothetical protein
MSPRLLESSSSTATYSFAVLSKTCATQHGWDRWMKEPSTIVLVTPLVILFRRALVSATANHRRGTSLCPHRRYIYSISSPPFINMWEITSSPFYYCSFVYDNSHSVCWSCNSLHIKIAACSGLFVIIWDRNFKEYHSVDNLHMF